MTMQETIAAAQVAGPIVQADGSAIFEFRFSKDDPTFAGHFPMRPVLPGVFQLEMARMAAERVLKSALYLHEIPKAKFLRPILPDELVRLDLKLSEKEDSIHARASFSVGDRPAGETLLILWRNG